MKRLQMLFLLLEREQKRRDDARVVLQGAIRNAEVQAQQADGLASYRGEYCAKWSANFQKAASMEILRSYHGFLSRLDHAIAQQAQVVAHAQRQVEAARAKLVEREIRLATVERLIERRQALLAKIADRRDQKNLDEMAARRTRELAGMA